MTCGPSVTSQLSKWVGSDVFSSWFFFVNFQFICVAELARNLPVSFWVHITWSWRRVCPCPTGHDVTAVFDTVNHAILLQRLQLTFGIGDSVHRWFQSYLYGRKQQVRRGSSRSSTTYVVCGVPQGSVLGPLLFVLYIVDLIQLVESHGLSTHLYVDDVQVYGSCSPADIDAFSTKISDCADDIADWARSNRLMLNPDKSEAIWCTTSRR